MVSLLSPPIAFVLVLVAVLCLFWLLGRLSLRPAPGTEASSKPYACGEDGEPIVQPDYGRVFPFAFYFTVLHVVALMAATVPKLEPRTLVLALLYVGSAAVGLMVLYRR